MTSHSLAKGLKAEGSRCAQHRGWAGRAAPCTAAPGGKASSAEMLNCFFHPFSSRAHLLPFLSLHALLQSQPLTFPATTRLTQSWLFLLPSATSPAGRGKSRFECSCICSAKGAFKREGHLHVAAQVCPVSPSSQEQRSKPQDRAELSRPASAPRCGILASSLEGGRC